jgi:ribosomal protein S18 acetylase RimI-like enzyme
MIAPATLSDVQSLVDLVNSAYRGDSSRHGWTTEADLLDGTRTDATVISELIQRPGTVLLKYTEQNEILGCVELKQEGNRLYLGMLTVQPGLQGKGLGKKLLAAAEMEGKKQKSVSIFMTVITAREELIAWYVRHGYQDTGERRPFIVPDTRWGVPKKNLEFMVLEKPLRYP